MSITETQNKAESLLYNAGILPVVTVDTVDQARRVVSALLEGGLTTIELTLRTPVALEALATLKREQPEITIGAGPYSTNTNSANQSTLEPTFLSHQAPLPPWHSC